MMIQIEWWLRSSDDSQWWSKSSDDRDLVMMIQQWWSKSRDDPNPVIMIQIEWWSRSKWRWLEDEYDLKMKMNWRWRWREPNDDPDHTEKMPCADKLCRENTFLVKRECWCNFNFGMYSSIYLMYCTLMFILIFFYNVYESCHNPMFIPGSFYNVNKSCQLIVGNPPICQGLKSSQLGP